MARIGEDRSERLDIVPAQLRVLVTIRPKYACRVCQSGITQAPAPAHLIEAALPSEGAIAHVLVAKYADHCPLYRQAQIYARSGLELDRSTLASWVGKAAFHLKPLVERMAELLKGSEQLFMDETTAPVLDPGRGKTKTGYLWALARDQRGWGGTDPPGVVYFYAPGRGGEHAEAFLKGFSGTLQVDGYAAYKRLAKPDREEGPLRLAFCWAHVRRKLREVFDHDKSEIAAEGLALIAQLYRIEAEIRASSAEERLDQRRACSAPLVEEFGRWLIHHQARLSAKSRLGEKLAYIAHHWDGLQVFLADGRVEIDSNLVENRIKPLATVVKTDVFLAEVGTTGSMAATVRTGPFPVVLGTTECSAAPVTISRCPVKREMISYMAAQGTTPPFWAVMATTRCISAVGMMASEAKVSLARSIGSTDKAATIPSSAIAATMPLCSVVAEMTGSTAVPVPTSRCSEGRVATQSSAAVATTNW